MKSKIIILSLILVMGLSLVYAFESPIYNIGVTIPLSDETGNVIIENPSSDEGGKGVSNIYSCGDWGDCIDNEIQERICTSGNLQIIETRKCLTNLIFTTPEEETQPKKTSRKFLTAAVTGVGDFATSPGGIATGLSLITILTGGLVLVSFRKKRLSKEK